MKKYILVEWPEYQFLLDDTRSKECYFCADENVYFCPEDLYDEIFGF